MTSRNVSGLTAVCDDHDRYTPTCQACRTHTTRWTKRYRLDLLRGHTRTVPAVGSTRRLRVLAREGWPARLLAERIGMSQRHVQDVQAERVTTVQRPTAISIARLYDGLKDTPGPELRTARRAEQRGWHTRNQWWDIDDPDEVPDPGWSPSRGGGTDIAADIDDIAWLITCGANWVSIVDRLGRSKESIERTLRRSYRHDLLRRLTLATSGPDQLLTSVEVRAMRTTKSKDAA